MLNISSLCKAEEGGDAVASLTDNKAVDDKIGSAGYHDRQKVSALVLQITTFPEGFPFDTFIQNHYNIP